MSVQLSENDIKEENKDSKRRRRALLEGAYIC